jgi:iron-sulfur cluster assembly protein
MAITLTERAAKHVQRFLSSNAGNGLRVAVKPTGCSGYMYVVQPAQEVNSHDQVFESQGVQIVIDDESLKYLDGTEVDFTREGLNEGFKFVNPNVKATCGCGESFSL